MTHSAQSFEIQQETYSKTILGFWVYLLTDCVLFAVLFTTYAVLQSQEMSSQNLFDLSLPLAETFILLTSSFTSGLGMLTAKEGKKKQVFIWMGISFVLGVFFIGLEGYEFHQLIQTGNSWKKNASLSSYFTLVGTHGLHVSVGLIWMLVMAIQLGWQGITANIFRRLACLNMFWHFLDVIWIFIFTFVYLMEYR